MKDFLIENSIQMYACGVVWTLGMSVFTWQYWVFVILLAVIMELRDNYIKKKAVQ